MDGAPAWAKVVSEEVVAVTAARIRDAANAASDALCSLQEGTGDD